MAAQLEELVRTATLEKLGFRKDRPVGIGVAIIIDVDVVVDHVGLGLDRDGGDGAVPREQIVAVYGIRSRAIGDFFEEGQLVAGMARGVEHLPLQDHDADR